MQSNTSPPSGSSSYHQHICDNLIIKNTQARLLTTFCNNYDQARLKASFSQHAGHWLNALRISSLGLRLDNESIRIAIGLRLGTNLCSAHVCPCGENVDSRGSHGLACRRSAGRHLRHNLINDTIWRALGRAQVAAVKEPLVF